MATIEQIPTTRDTLIPRTIMPTIITITVITIQAVVVTEFMLAVAVTTRTTPPIALQVRENKRSFDLYLFRVF